jgi:hypothetical protein
VEHPVAHGCRSGLLIIYRCRSVLFSSLRGIEIPRFIVPRIAADKPIAAAVDVTDASVRPGDRSPLPLPPSSLHRRLQFIRDD